MTEKLANKIFKVLSPSEIKKGIRVIFYDFLITILDIAFLLLLFLVVAFYSKGFENSPVKIPGLFQTQPLFLLAVIFLGFIFKNYAGYHITKVHFQFLYDVASRISRQKMVEYLEGRFEDFVNVDSSVHINKISHQPIQFSHYVLNGAMQIITQLLLLIVTIALLLVYNAMLFLLLFVVIIPSIVLTFIFFKRKLHNSRTNAKIASEKSLQHLQEGLAGFIESKVFQKKEFFTSRYHSRQLQLNTHLAHQSFMQSIPSRLIEVLAMFGLFVLMLLQSIFSEATTLNVITLGAFVAASYKIIPGVVKIINSIGQIKTYQHTLFDLSWKEVSNKPEVGNSKIHSFTFADVSFKYNQNTFLKKVCMHATAGDFVGMSGPSGKGKTTFVNLLLGLVDANEGAVTINGVPASTTQNFWKSISYVKQQPFLLNDTIATNITLEDKTSNSGRLKEVLAITGLNEVVHDYAYGIETLITEHGRNLSGGQRQRIALARALYKQFDLLILDEPCSELDEESEMRLMQHLKDLAATGKIIVLVTHNKTALEFCNKTVYMDACI